MEILFKYLKEFYNSSFKHKQTFLYLVLFFFFVGSYQFISSPKLYQIQAVLIKNDFDEAPQQTDNSLASLARIVGASSGGSSFYQALSRFHSMSVARLMKEAGYMDFFFRSSFDPDKKEYLKDLTFSDRLGAFLMDYEINPNITDNDLRNAIKSKVLISISRDQSEIYVNTLHKSPQEGLKLITDIINFTDASFRLERKEYISAQRGYFQNIVDSNKSISLRESYINQLISLETRLASLESELPFVYKLQDDISVSAYPVTPNLTKIIISNLVIPIILFFIYLLLRMFSPVLVNAWKES